MNKSESKYFHTALLMDEALLALLEKKDFAYITVKEICEKAGVNRSTFYLHYETIGDLVKETTEMVNNRFLSYFSKQEKDIAAKIADKQQRDLIFITEDYLRPYLQFILDNKNIYRAAFRNPGGMQVDEQYKHLKQQILKPVLSRFAIPESIHKYYIAYYVEGIMAIVGEWLHSDCHDPVDTMVLVIRQCVRPPVPADSAGESHTRQTDMYR